MFGFQAPGSTDQIGSQHQGDSASTGGRNKDSDSSPSRITSGHDPGQSGKPIDGGVSARVGKDIDDLIAPIEGIVVGRGPNGRRLSDTSIKKILGPALQKLKQARASGRGSGSAIGTAVTVGPEGNIILSPPNGATADGLVSATGGGLGRTSAASGGARSIVTLLPDAVDSTPVGRGAVQFVRRAVNASSVDSAGLPVFVIGPRGYPRTALMIERVYESGADVIAVVDEVPIR